MADNVIDTLSIEIVSEAQKAEEGLNRLIAGLGNLNTSLTSVDSQGIKKFSSAMKKLTDTKNLTSLNSITTSLKQFVTDMNSIGQVSFDVLSLTMLIDSIKRLGGVKATQATSNLPQISKDLTSFINTINNLTSSGTGVEHIVSLSSALTRLGGKNVASTLSNLPLLATALRDFFNTMSQAPEVSNNIIEMTTALANLAAQGGRVGTASRTISNGINGTLLPMRNARNASISLARAFGKLYANYFLVIRGIKALGNAFKSSADYLEAYNYYNVAFGKIADEWAEKDFKKYGYESAEAYASSFTERMDELFGKMSGQKVDIEAGMILDTGDKSLGLDIQKMTQYASNIAAVGNSMKMTGEATVVTSKAMTMLAGDLSSLKNIELDEVMNNLQSGLIGQSRALYKYGIDITNATLQTYAYKYGVNQAISELTQGEKAQLRMLAVLDQSRVAWGDLANTLNTPSNQLRMLKTNFANLSRAIGSLFIPVITKVLPIINGVVIAIQRLVSWIGAFFGIKINFDDFSQGYSELGDGLEEIADGYEDATTAAKKFKAQLRGWDEVNNLTSNDDSNSNKPIKSGSLDLTKQMMDALAEYEKQWNSAFENMENKALEWASKIDQYFAPVKEFIKNIAESSAWKTFTTVIGELIDKLKNVPKALGIGLVTFIEGIAAVGTVVISGINIVLEGLAIVLEMFGIDYKEIGVGLGVLLTAILAFKAANAVISIINSIPTAIGGLITLIVTNPIGAVIGLIGGLVAAIAGFSALDGIDETADMISESVQKIVDSVKNSVESIKTQNNDISAQYQAVSDIADKYFELAENFDNLTEEEMTMLKTYASILVDDCPELKDSIDTVTGAFIGEKDAVYETITSLEKLAKQQAMQEILKDLYKEQYQAQIELTQKTKEFGLVQDEIVEYLWEATKANDSLTKSEFDRYVQDSTFMELYNDYSDIVSRTGDKLKYSKEQVVTLTNDISSLNTTIIDSQNGIEAATQTIIENSKETDNNSKAIRSLSEEERKLSEQSRKTKDEIEKSNKLTSGSYNVLKTDAKKSLYDMETNLSKFAKSSLLHGSTAGSNLRTSYSTAIKPMESDSSTVLANIASIFTTSGASIGSATGDNIANGINDSISKKKSTLASTLAGVFGNIKLSLSSLAGKLGFNVDAYATGGFVNSSSLFMAGENGVPEMLGTVGGRTAVAGGAEITGISDTIYNTSQQEMELMREEITLLRQLLNKPTLTSSQAFKAVQNEARAYSSRANRPAF